MTIPLYHYTNLEALINILKTNTLWTTNCEYSNDLLELRDLERMLNDSLSTADEKFREFIYCYKDFYKILRKIRGQAYIISFSSDNDSVAMWRNYDKSGVVLEFDTSLMIKKLMVNVTILIDKNNKPKIVLCEKKIGNAIYTDDGVGKMLFMVREINKRSKEFDDEKIKKDLTDNIFDLFLDTLYSIYFKKKIKTLVMKKKYV